MFVKVMQTEWSMLDAAPDTDTGFPASYDAASDMDIALFMGKLIYIGLTSANMSSWSYWTAMSQSMYSQKNRFELLRLNATGDTGYESYGNLTKGGSVTVTPNLWVLGNYSRFVRPGYTRIAFSDGSNLDDINKLMATAFVSPDAKRMVAVFVNNSTSAQYVKFNTQAAVVRKYVTDRTHTLSRDSKLSETPDSTSSVTIPARSVVTFTFDGDFTSNIRNVKADHSTSNAIYSLNGQLIEDNDKQLSALPQGIYIVNGKKALKR